MVRNKFLPKLSQNLLEILNDDEYHDITIEVGIDPYVKIFRAHMVILNYRSPYLQRILSTNQKKNDGTLNNIKLPNILPEIFQIILRYIYSGRLSLKEYDATDIIKILISANELGLQEIIPYLESYLIENNTNWMEQNFDLIYETSFKNDSFSELQKYCINLINEKPDKIFESTNFTSIPEKLLLSIIQSENLQMNEIQVWNYVIKWGLAKNPELSSNPTNFSKDDFNTLKNTLQKYIPFIKFYKLTSKEFLYQVLPYKKVLPKELYKDLIKYFLDPDDNLHSNDEAISHTTKETKQEFQSELETTKETEEDQSKLQINKETKQILLAHQIIEEDEEIKSKLLTTKEDQSEIETTKETNENQSINEPTKEIQSKSLFTKEIKSNNIDSKIISNHHAELILKWIDKVDTLNSSNTYTFISKFIFTHKSNYLFKLLFRGSRDGFAPKNFHDICDNQSRTVTIIKVKDSNEILGGYNPIAWKSTYGYGATKDSFIFSFINGSNNNYILSRIKIEKNAINFWNRYGPSFGFGDLIIYGGPGNDYDFYDHNNNYCKKRSYEKPIRESSETFSIEEYEVFQIIKN
ncbi:hypothetical protein C1645_873541 [Glomus cerebriforme]|uniref:Kelch-like protein 17 n=1 Tax=Glomus cerebriforme TaxID=658196 RepID=A0A397TBE2_9GLOM|nr:hypothetical protein C1645_873541 [Glomus cerebriforme]